MILVHARDRHSLRIILNPFLDYCRSRLRGAARIMLSTLKSNYERQ